MVRPTVVVAGLLALAVAGCGEKDEPEVSGPPVVETTPGPETGDGRGRVGLERVGEFSEPVYLAQAKGERALYVVERAGRIMRLGGGGRTEVFLDVSRGITADSSEQGLLSMAFSPDYRRSGRFYVDFTDRAGNTRVVEYRRSKRDESRADPRTARLLLKVRQPFDNHNGGLLLFDREGNLLIGLGDGGSGGDPDRNGQDLGVLLGKILRIDPRPAGGKPYRIPAGNPFADQAGARPEILTYGLRNPWRFSFDPESGALWIGDVGQDEQEEIDVLEDVESGANFGWSAFEGTERFNEDQQAPDAVEPVLTYGREGGCSVTGGYVVRDRGLTALYGRYLYADFCVGQLRSFSAEGGAEGEARDDTALGVQVPAISSFAEDTQGRIYALSLEGPVYRLVPEGS